MAPSRSSDNSRKLSRNQGCLYKPSSVSTAAASARGAASPVAKTAPPSTRLRRVSIDSSPVNGKTSSAERGRHGSAPCAIVTQMCFRLPALKRFAAAMLLALACTAPAHADDLDDFNRAVEAAMSHHRVAAGYLRTGNIDLAALELEGLRESWGKVTSLRKPAAFRDQERYTGTMLDISTKLVGVVLVLDLGSVEVARQSLDAIRASLSGLRRANGVTVLADCVIDSNTAMDALFVHDARPDWPAVPGSAQAYRATLQRCDGMAPPAI